MESEAPIQSLPPEIIGEIILHALGYYGPRRGLEPVMLDTRLGPWVYSQVCRVWRQETLRLTKIWSNIRLDRTTDRFAAVVDVLETVLSRSPPGHPLDIIVDYDPNQYTELILDLLAAQSPRWRNVRLSMDAHLTVWLSEKVTDLSSLRSLDHVDAYNGSTLDCRKLGKHFLSNVPSLRRVSLSGTVSLSALNVPWSQLTHFRATLDVDIESLNNMPNLVFFETYRLGDTNPSGPLVKPANLRHLGLRCLDPVETGSRSRLRVPPGFSTVHVVQSYDFFDHQTFFRNSGCSAIQTLILGDGVNSLSNTDESAQLIDWLVELTTVTTLEIRGAGLYALFHILLKHDPPILPNLRMLRLCSNAPMLYNWHFQSDFVKATVQPNFIEFLRVRIRGGSLKELCFSGSFHKHSEEVLAEVERRYRERIGELPDVDRFMIRFMETDIWGEPLGH